MAYQILRYAQNDGFYVANVEAGMTDVAFDVRNVAADGANVSFRATDAKFQATNVAADGANALFRAADVSFHMANVDVHATPMGGRRKQQGPHGTRAVPPFAI